MKRKTNWWVPVFGVSLLLAGPARGEIQKVPKDAVASPVSPAPSNKGSTGTTSAAPPTSSKPPAAQGSSGAQSSSPAPSHPRPSPTLDALKRSEMGQANGVGAPNSSHEADGAQHR